MKRTATIAMLAVLVMAFGGAAEGAEIGGAAGAIAPPPAALRARIDRLVRPLVEGHVVLGLSIGIVDGDASYLADYGSVSLAKPEEPTGETLYEIGSITKVFTGILLAEAVDRKQVSLDDPVQKSLPASVHVPLFGTTPITLLSLATHRSGLPRMPTNFAPKDPRNPFADYDESRLFAFLSGHKLEHKPGETYDYSNLGVGLLGFALARRSGESYEALLKTGILEPLKMTHTMITLTPAARARMAQGTNGDLEPEPNWDLGALQGAGAIRSDIVDMTRFLRANLEPSATPIPDALRLAQKPEAPTDGGAHIGLAWQITPGGDVVWHNGATGGFRSMLAFDRARRQGIVVLCSTGADAINRLGFDLLKAVAGASPVPPKVLASITLPRATLQRCVGSYELAPGAVLAIKLSGDSLVAQLTGQRAYRIHPSSETEFFYRVVEARLTFTRNEKGAVTGLVLHQNGRDLPARKIK